MSISLSISEVRAVILASHINAQAETKNSSWDTSLRVEAEWGAFNIAYDSYTADPQASTFVVLRAHLKTLKGTIRSFDEALAQLTSK